ncbi:MAG TPA: ATPase, T2SS/T4P/T4SS family, partial [Candidatus Nanoarchaeia archaeon]|nr:ATPase, T2SS/T4P/T4SS family [Candidatus Nanoarchaeia archaeon]
MKTYVTDTSVLIERQVSELVRKKEIEGIIVVPNAVLAELEHQANTNQTEGFLGLEEIKELRKIAEETKKISIEYAGAKPTEAYIKGARGGAIDDIIREVAVQKKATLVTADRVQALVGEALGISVMLLTPLPAKEVGKLNIEKFFDEKTMSIHIKESTVPFAKKGKPGMWSFVSLQKEPLTGHEIRLLTSDIIEKTKLSENAFVELNTSGVTIVQFKNYRIVITKPPFADGWELTAVRPIATLELEDYKLSRKLIERLERGAAGILISGAPGGGKTTFAAALAKFYLKLGKIIKTIESPRDLQVPDEVVQYSKNLGSRDDIHNVMLLTRPDYTIFDEMRVTEDFRLYADLRLAG